MKYFVYVLFSLKDNKRYIGCTSHIDLRMHQHSAGLVKSTKNRRPLKLMYYEEFQTKKDAMCRERFFKTGIGRNLLNGLISLNKGE